VPAYAALLSFPSFGGAGAPPPPFAPGGAAASPAPAPPAFAGAGGGGGGGVRAWLVSPPEAPLDSPPPKSYG
jgi:hypothetical protein